MPLGRRRKKACWPALLELTDRVRQRPIGSTRGPGNGVDMMKAVISGRWWLWALLGFGGGAVLMAPASHSPPLPAAAAREVRAELDAVERNVVDVFQRVSPAVVNVSNIAQRRSLFNVQEVPQGSGTGFVWDKKGHVVTNYHVIH